MRFFDHCTRFVQEVDNNASAVVEVSNFKQGPEMRRVREKIANRLRVQRSLITYGHICVCVCVFILKQWVLWSILYHSLLIIHVPCVLWLCPKFFAWPIKVILYVSIGILQFPIWVIQSELIRTAITDQLWLVHLVYIYTTESVSQHETDNRLSIFACISYWLCMYNHNLRRRLVEKSVSTGWSCFSFFIFYLEVVKLPQQVGVNFVIYGLELALRLLNMCRK